MTGRIGVLYISWTERKINCFVLLCLQTEDSRIEEVNYVHNVQVIFRDWFNEWLKVNQLSDNDNLVDDFTDSVILKAPVYDPTLFIPASVMNNIKLNRHEAWSLQDAVVYIFSQYLSKRDTLNKWSIGLDIRLVKNDRKITMQHRQRLIQYASYDCLSLGQIMVFMYEFYLSFVKSECQIYKSMGEYFSGLDKNFVSILGKTNSKYDFIFDDDSNSDEVTVYDLYERHIDSSEFCRENSRKLQEFNQQQLENEQQQHLEMNQEHLNDQQCFDVNSEPLIIEQQATINEQHVEVNYKNQKLIQEPDIYVNISSSSTKKKRSVAARKERNKKTSLRHRTKRYHYEIIRRVNMSITEVKTILNYYGVPRKNINIVGSTLYIGVHSQDIQDYYAQLLPTDLFH